jgi:hypothetical protein
MKKMLRLRYPTTVTAMNNLATTLHSHGRFEEAERMMWEVLAIAKEVLGLRHPNTIAYKRNVDNMHMVQNRVQLEEYVLEYMASFPVFTNFG